MGISDYAQLLRRTSAHDDDRLLHAARDHVSWGTRRSKFLLAAGINSAVFTSAWFIFALFSVVLIGQIEKQVNGTTVCLLSRKMSIKSCRCFKNNEGMSG